MWLILAYPEIAAKTCTDCIRYQTDGQGLIVREERRGKRIGLRIDSPPKRRSRRKRPPCRQCPKMPSTLTENDGLARPGLAVELTEENQKCFDHYLRCKAISWQVPERLDPLVMHHARMLDGIVAQAERFHAARNSNQSIMVVLEAMKAMRGLGRG